MEWLGEVWCGALSPCGLTRSPAIVMTIRYIPCPTWCLPRCLPRPRRSSDNDVEDILREFVSLRGFPGKYSFESLSKEAFSVRNFSRKTVYQLYEKHRAMIGDLKVEDEDLMATAYRHPSIWCVGVLGVGVGVGVCVYVGGGG